MSQITIRGAGIMGLTCAWVLHCRGANVCVVDPHGVAVGASGGLVGALAPHVPENWNWKKEFQFQALDEASTLWSEIDAASGLSSGYGRTGRVQPLMDERSIELAQMRAEGAQDLWKGRYQWQVCRQNALPIEVESPTGWFVVDTLTARIHPRRACASLAAALQNNGVAIREQTEPGDGTEIWATGVADLERISAHFGKTIGGAVKGQAALLNCDLRTAPQIFADGLHIVPHEDGTLAVGSTSERDFDDPRGTDARLSPLIEKAKQVVPALRHSEVIERWAGLRPRARSRAPMVGPHPLEDGAFIANGGFKIGFAMAPVVANLLADLILDGNDRIPPDFLPGASL